MVHLCGNLYRTGAYGNTSAPTPAASQLARSGARPHPTTVAGRGHRVGPGEKMKGVNRKNRVTFYYLLADHYGKLSLFG